jgi:hypothetical protein
MVSEKSISREKKKRSVGPRKTTKALVDET